MARDIIMPDGTVLENMPTNTSKTQALASWQKLQDMVKPKPVDNRPGFGQVALRTGVESLTDNIAGATNFIGNAITGLAIDPAIPGEVPRLELEGSDLMGVGQRAGELAGAVRMGDFSQFTPGSASENQARITQEMRSQRPRAAIVGDVAGDAAFMMGARPLATGAANAATQAVGSKIAGWATGPMGVKRLLGSGAEKFIRTNLPRGVGRMADLSVQSAILAYLDDQDPLRAAGFAAGTQGAGSLVLSAAKPIVFSKFGLLSAVAGATVAMNMFGLPGVQDMSLGDTVKTASMKIIPTVLAGTTLGLAGFDRLPASVRNNMPRLTDAITSIQTGAVAGLVQELSEEQRSGGDTMSAVLQKFSSDPEYFGQTAMRRIQNAIENEDVSLGEVVDSLFDNEEFNKRLQELK